MPSLREFLRDFCFTIAEVLHGDAAAVASLAELGAVDKQQLMEQAFRSCGDASRQILDFEIDEKYLHLGRNRICPACLRADMGSAVTDETVSKAYARILWSYSSARSILREFGHILPTGIEAVSKFAREHGSEVQLEMPEIADGILGVMCH
ncbi:MAG TPA: hypothetical protein VIN05_02355, partial [Roseovarius sp.]